MNDIIIKAENLGKKYIIGHQAKSGRYVALRDVLVQNARTLWNKTKDMAKGKPIIQGDTLEEVWALKDVSFKIKRGEVIGIIGRNGAGKSTLLKVLSRITEPSAGRVMIKGRVASLLEVGTGFHPELTGRENIYLNGTILGMTRREIRRKFDEIVAFAGIEKYLDTPVKRYSSGMYVRLAFAVAANMEPEILLVDEVLAVGDATFQKKCLGKMGAVAEEGRTVLFVSHNMPMITSLCPRCLLLEEGKISLNGRTSDVVMHYYSSGTSSPTRFEFSDNGKKPGDDFVELLSGEVLDLDNNPSVEFDITQPIKIMMRFRVLKKDGLKLIPNFHFHSGDGSYAFISGLQDTQILEPGDYDVECAIPGNLLNDDTYFIGLAITSLESGVRVHFYEQSSLSFVVKDDLEGRQGYSGRIPGVVRPKLDWKIKRLP